jgi:hypothetical protein
MMAAHCGVFSARPAGYAAEPWFGTCAATTDTHANPKKVRRDYAGEVDAFAVYCPETCGVYLIPMTDLPIRVRGALRVDPPKNCQVKFIRYAATYEIGRMKVHAPDSVSD